jgi:hypothetical protein
MYNTRSFSSISIPSPENKPAKHKTAMQIRLPKHKALPHVITTLQTQMATLPAERRPAVAQRLAALQSANERLQRLALTACELDALTLIAQLRIAPTSAILALLPAHRTTVHRALQRLFQRGIVRRFTFPVFSGLTNPGEMHYFIDSTKTLDLLASERGLSRDDLRAVVRRDITKLLVQPKRAQDYIGRFLHLKHETGLSRLQTTVRLVCQRSSGQIELVRWLQGSLTWDTVRVPKFVFEQDRVGSGRWIESPSEEEDLEFRPDVVYSLRFHDDFEGSRDVSFVYERDRHRNNSAVMREKFRAAFHYLVRQRKHRARYGIDRIRAVQVETEGESWRDHLRQQVAHPTACGQANGLFWFTSSELFTQPISTTSSKHQRPVTVPRFLHEPEVILRPIWYTAAGQTPVSLTT